MPKVVGVRFHGVGKAYDFDPGDMNIVAGDAVIVETSMGIEYGIASYPAHEKTEEQLFGELRPVLRKANEADERVYSANLVKEKEAYNICRDRIEKHALDMSLVDVEYTFDGSKIIFYFISDNRVDFRELVKDLATIFHRRIELRQIGARDEARMVGGVGICGRTFCCSTFLDDFVPVSVKMAKFQNLSMNPTKISGCCGRLMCCLKYEQEAYEEARKIAPKQGSVIQTPQGEGRVISVDLLRERAGILIFGPNGEEVVHYDFAEMEYQKGHNEVAGNRRKKPAAKTEKSRQPAAPCDNCATKKRPLVKEDGQAVQGLKIDEDYTTKAVAFESAEGAVKVEVYADAVNAEQVKADRVEERERKSRSRGRRGSGRNRKPGSQAGQSGQPAKSGR